MPNSTPANPSLSFELAPQLAKDTQELKTIGGQKLYLSYAGLMNDKRYPWIILIPKRPNITELTELTNEDRHQLMDEITLTSKTLQKITSPHKLNIGALGNIVSQLHIHIIARQQTDAAWPNPIWGHGKTEPYNAQDLATIISQIETS